MNAIITFPSLPTEAPSDSSPLAHVAYWVNFEHERAHEAMSRGLSHALRAGGLLKYAKEHLPHGAFLPWVRANCTFSVRLAQCYMRLVREFPGEADVAGEAYRLDDPNTQRVAHFNELSMRQALKVITAKEEDEGGGEFPIIDPNKLKTDYECPHCGYEWSGSPKPRVASKAALRAMRDRVDGEHCDGDIETAVTGTEGGMHDGPN